MKKSFLMIITVATLLTSCANNDSFKASVVEEKADQPLSFTAYADKVTKGSNSNALNDFYTVFGVYGWKTVNGAVVTSAVFDNVPNEYFTGDNSGSVVYKTSGKPGDEWVLPGNIGTGEGKRGYWYYENVRYWDKMATNYQFFAIAPYEASETPIYSVHPGDDNFAIATAEAKYDISTENNIALAGTPAVPQSTELKYSGFKKDFMIADKKSVQPTAANTSADVQLVFHHILTKLNVNIKKADDYKGKQILQVNKLHIVNLAKKGNFVFDTNMITDGWNKAEKYDLKIDTEYPLANAATNYDNYYWIETLIFPQTTNCKKAGAQPSDNGLSDLYLYIQYQIGNEQFNAYYDLAYVFDNTLAPVAATYYTAAEANQYNQDNNLVEGDADFKVEGAEKTEAIPGGDFEFKQGSQYNLTITVGPDPIHFDAEVFQWITETAGTISID